MAIGTHKRCTTLDHVLQKSYNITTSNYYSLLHAGALMDNRRQCARHELAINFPVINIRTKKRCGYLLDITPEGFQLASEQSFTSYDVLHARIEGNFGKGYESGIEISGICKWCRPDVNKRYYRAGFEISDEFGRDPVAIIGLICRNRV